MSQIRKAHSNEIIDKQLRQFETVGEIDPMDLVGLHDELSRVERKRLEKTHRQPTGGKSARPLANAQEHNYRFDRLTRLVDATLRRVQTPSPERQLLQKVSGLLNARKPVAE